MINDKLRNHLWLSDISTMRTLKTIDGADDEEDEGHCLATTAMIMILR
jgi:hypothetical protein